MCNIQGAFVVCPLEVEVGLLQGDPPEKTFACIEEFKEKIKPIYNEAKKAIENNKAATEALKELYSYWLTSMAALIPGSGETKGEYRRKLSARQLGIDERENKLKVELY